MQSLAGDVSFYNMERGREGASVFSLESVPRSFFAKLQGQDGAGIFQREILDFGFGAGIQKIKFHKSSGEDDFFFTGFHACWE